MRKFLAYFHMAFSDALVYRATGFIWMLNDTGPALVMFIFWLAAFQTRNNISGYTVSSMAFYYLGVMLVNNLVTTHPQYILSEEIRSGAFSNYLIKPINLALYKLAAAISWRIIRSIFFLPVMLLLWWFFSAHFQQLSLSLINALLFILSLFLAFLINFLIKMILALTTIWFIESGWIFNCFNILAALFSGELVPLDLFPKTLIIINNFLPFKYMLYFPLSLILNQPSFSELTLGFLIDFGWVAFFYWFYRQVLKRGGKIYCAYGG